MADSESIWTHRKIDKNQAASINFTPCGIVEIALLLRQLGPPGMSAEEPLDGLVEKLGLRHAYPRNERPEILGIGRQRATTNARTRTLHSLDQKLSP